MKELKKEFTLEFPLHVPFWNELNEWIEWNEIVKHGNQQEHNAINGYGI